MAGLHPVFTAPIILLVVAEQLLTVMQWIGSSARVDVLVIIDGISSIITWFTTAAAVAWWGMWMGLRSRKAHLAVLKTFVFVVLVPTVIAIVLIGAVALFLNTPGLRLASSVSFLFWIAKDALFILWARRNLYLDFRKAAAGESLPRHSTNLVEFIRSLRLRNAQT